MSYILPFLLSLRLEEDDSRPFMTLNLDTPSPTAYHPPTDPPSMTTSPSYTMRPTTYPEKGRFPNLLVLSVGSGLEIPVLCYFRWW
jgi:hypothetical protein